jgi:uncharacterized repeat protein (TIGR01451 family)
MQNAIWKLTALAGVIGIGFLVALQAQRSITHPKPGNELANEIQNEVDGEEAPKAVASQNTDLGEQGPPPQSEPAFDPAPDGQNAGSAMPAVVPASHTADAGSSSGGISFAGHDAPANSGAAPAADTFAPAPEPDDQFTVAPSANAHAPATPAVGPGTIEANAFDPFAPAPASGHEESQNASTNGSQTKTPAEPEAVPGAAPAPDALFGATDIPDNAPAAKTSTEPAEFDHEAGATAAPSAISAQESPSRAKRTRPDRAKRSQDTANDGPKLLQPNPLEGATDSPRENPVPAEDPPRPEPSSVGEAPQIPSPAASSSAKDRPHPLSSPTAEFAGEGEQPPTPKKPANTLVPDPNAFRNDPRRTGLEKGDASGGASHDVPRRIVLPEESGDTEPRPPAQPFIEPGLTAKRSSDSDAPSAVHDTISGTSPRRSAAQPETRAQPQPDAGSEPNRFNPPPEATELSTPPGEPKPAVSEAAAPPEPAGTIEVQPPAGTQRPQLKIEKVAPPTAVLGQPLIYHIIVTNSGTATARQVTVEDRVPEGAELTGTIPRAVLTGNRLSWKIGDVEPGQSQKISIRVTPRAPGRIGSVATVNFVSEITSQTLVTAPKLNVDLASPGQARVGDPVQFNFKVTNTGSGDAEHVVIRSIIPRELEHPGGHDLEYEIGKLPAGESKVVQLSMTAARAGEAVNRAVVTAAGGVSVETKAAVRVVGSNLVLSRTGPEHRLLGRTAVYQNVVTNKASHAIDKATLVETIPAGLEFVEANEGGQYYDSNRTVAWRIERLGPGDSKVVKVTLRAIEAGTQVSKVSSVEPSGAKTEVTSTTEVQGFASLGLEIPPVEGPVGVGEPISLRISARNRGNIEASNAKLKLTVPKEMEIVSIKSPVRYATNGQSVEFAPLPGIGGQSAAEFEVVLKAREAGDVRVGIEIHADQMQQPLRREEPILVFPKSS